MWFSSKKKEKTNSLGSLPELPELPDLPFEKPAGSTQFISKNEFPQKSAFSSVSSKEQIHSLPRFPNSDMANKMSREAIKSALESPAKSYAREADFSGQKEDEDEEDFMAPASLPQFKPRSAEKTEPIFVRIDKFQASEKTLAEVKRQVSEIESYLSEVKKVKAKEDEEIQIWETEILELKAKLESVDKNLFGKFE